MILSVAPAPFEAERLIEGFQAGEIQGVIMAEQLQGEAPHRLTAAGVPLVVANCEADCTAVVSRMDFRAVGRLAGRRIVVTGCREVGVLAGNLGSFIFREMLAGFRGALAEEEIALPKKWICEVPANLGDAAAAAELKRILAAGKHPRVWFAMRDIRASHLYTAAAELGLRIPEDIGIIGYDNVSWPEAKVRGLTTISQPVAAIGAGAVRLLAEWFAAGKAPADLVFDGELIERRSLPELPVSAQ